MDSARVAKADVLKYALESLHIAPSERVVMVGDREHDVLGAEAVGLACVPRTTMNGPELAKELGLEPGVLPLLNVIAGHPIR